MSADNSNQTGSAVTNRGWIVTFAGLGINLALGILYAWSLIKGQIGETFGWDGARLNDPYAVGCLVFAGAVLRCAMPSSGSALTA